MAASTIPAPGGQVPPGANSPVPTDPHHQVNTQSPGLRSAGGAESLATGCALVVCVVAQLPHQILRAAGIRPWGLALFVVVAVVSGVRAAVRTPFTLPHALREGPDRATAIRRWVSAELTIVVATIAVGTMATVPLYALLRATPAWWLPAWLLFAGVTVGWQLFVPVAIRAQAGPLTPAAPELAQRLHPLALRAGVDIGDGVVVAGKPGRRRCNAYVLGMGPTRRVVLEQAVAAWPPELVDQVVAHELGHWRLGHTARRLPLTLLSQLATLVAAAAVLSYEPVLHGAGLTVAGDPRSYPLLLVVGAIVVLPARCLLAWRDRAQERAADRFALTLLDRPDDFTAMLQRAADESGAPRTLPWWRRPTASHPPVDERVALSMGVPA